MRGDEVVVHIERMRGRVAQAGDAVDLRQRADQSAEAPDAAAPDAAAPDAPRCFAVVGVHVLPQQGDLLHAGRRQAARSEEHTSELQSLMRISYAVFCLKKKNKQTIKEAR